MQCQMCNNLVLQGTHNLTMCIPVAITGAVNITTKGIRSIKDNQICSNSC